MTNEGKILESKDNIITASPTEENVGDSAVTTRKRRSSKSGNSKRYYFGEREEKAFVQYQQSKSPTERNKIFQSILYPAFSKMVESIIRTYHLFTPDEDFNDTFCDTLSFLITKINNFDVSKGYKVYSYCGTVCKNYLIFKRDKCDKHRKKYLSYDTPAGASINVEDRSDSEDSDFMELDFNTELLDHYIWHLQDMLDPTKESMISDNERSVGNALLDFLMNWEDLFCRMGSNKFNKTSFFYFLREYTRLETPQIREALVKYRDLYYLIKEDMIKEIGK